MDIHLWDLNTHLECCKNKHCLHIECIFMQFGTTHLKCLRHFQASITTANDNFIDINTSNDHTFVHFQYIQFQIQLHICYTEVRHLYITVRVTSTLTISMPRDSDRTFNYCLYDDFNLRTLITKIQKNKRNLSRLYNWIHFNPGREFSFQYEKLQSTWKNCFSYNNAIVDLSLFGLSFRRVWEKDDIY